LSQYALSRDLTNKQNTLTASTTLLGLGSNIIALNYANISNPPTLIFLPLTGGTISSTLNVHGILTVNYPDVRINPVNGVSLLTLEGRILGTYGYSGVFGGDMYGTAYWGKVVCINGGVLGDNASAGAAKIANTSSFSIYARSSG
jgi:hypothetical protein